MEEVFAREPLLEPALAPFSSAADDEIESRGRRLGNPVRDLRFVGEKKLKQLVEEALSTRCRAHGSPVALQQTRLGARASAGSIESKGVPGAFLEKGDGKTLDEAQRIQHELERQVCFPPAEAPAPWPHASTRLAASHAHGA